MAAPQRNRPQPNYKFTIEGDKKVLITPVFYAGKGIGHGNYMAGSHPKTGLILDKENVPIPYSLIDLPNWKN